MKWRLGVKVSSIAAVILLLMLIVSVSSAVHMTALQKHLFTTSTLQIPASEAMSRVNVRVLEQGLLMDQILAMSETNPGLQTTPYLERFQQLSSEVETEFASARALLEREAASDSALTQVVDILDDDLRQIREAVDNFAAHGLSLLQHRLAGNEDLFRSGFSQLSDFQTTFNDRLDLLRSHTENLTQIAVTNAQTRQRYVISLNYLLTILASLIGIIFSTLVIRSMLKAVRKLVMGTREVEAGNLSMQIEPSSRDEIGELSISFNHMVEGLRMKERIRDTFGKYMDPRIVSHLLDNPELTDHAGTMQEMTVLFADVQGFTSLSESLGPESSVKVINCFFDRAAGIIGKHNGVVDKFIGDAVMAFWGEPFCAATEHAQLACDAAAEIAASVGLLREEVSALIGGYSQQQLDFRIGIATGLAIVGTVGSRASRSFTIMGDTVNLGSRLEGVNKVYGTRVLVSQRTREYVHAIHPCREVDVIRVKGRTTPERIYELRETGTGDAESEASFIEGLAAYRARDWSRAAALFSANAGDPVADMYAGRVAALQQHPPGDDWDGIWNLEEK